MIILCKAERMTFPHKASYWQNVKSTLFHKVKIPRNLWLSSSAWFIPKTHFNIRIWTQFPLHTKWKASLCLLNNNQCTPGPYRDINQSNANPEHRWSNGKPLWYFSDKWEVDKGRIIIVEVQEVHIHCSAGWRMQWRRPNWGGQHNRENTSTLHCTTLRFLLSLDPLKGKKILKPKCQFILSHTSQTNAQNRLIEEAAHILVRQTKQRMCLKWSISHE